MALEGVRLTALAFHRNRQGSADESVPWGRPPLGRTASCPANCYGRSDITVLTPIAAHVLAPQATSTSAEGTYLSTMSVTLRPFSVASHGLWSVKRTTSAHRVSLTQANALALLASFTLCHKRAKVRERTNNDPLVVEASATQS